MTLLTAIALFGVLLFHTGVSEVITTAFPTDARWVKLVVGLITVILTLVVTIHFG